MISFSVVITTKNRNALCYRALTSLISQEGCVSEVIIVDDFSETPFVPPSDFNHGFTFKVIRNEFSLGPAASRNLAVKNCTSDYILFLDDDDMFTKDKVNVLTNKLTGIEDVVYHDFYSCYPDFGILFQVKKKDFEKEDSRRKLSEVSLNNFIGGMPTICVKRKFFEKIGGFDQSLPALEDWEFNIRCIRFNATIIHVDSPLTCCNYFINRKSVSSALINNLKAFILIDKKINNNDGLLNRIRRHSCFFVTIGSAMRLRKRILLSIIFYLTSFIIYPNFRCLLLLFSSFLPLKSYIIFRKKISLIKNS